MNNFLDRKFFHILLRCCWIAVQTQIMICYKCFIAGAIDTGDKLLAVLLLPAINYRLYRCYRRLIIAGVVITGVVIAGVMESRKSGTRQ